MKRTLKQLRKKLRLTQADAAESLGVSVDTVARWEYGATQPNALQIVEIRRVYGCKFEDIIWPRQEES